MVFYAHGGFANAADSPGGKSHNTIELYPVS